jgi:hypothetical protein
VTKLLVTIHDRTSRTWPVVRCRCTGPARSESSHWPAHEIEPGLGTVVVVMVSRGRLRRPAGEAGDFRRVPISAAAFRMVVMALPFSHVPGRAVMTTIRDIYAAS